MPSSANDNQPVPDAAPARPCPICSKPQDAKYRPFCSRRCADVDLARWLGGRYSIAAAPGLDDDEEDSLRPEDSGDAAR